MRIEEIVSGKLEGKEVDDGDRKTISSIEHLIIKEIGNKVCVINSFTNRCIIMESKDWHGIGDYPQVVAEALEKKTKTSVSDSCQTGEGHEKYTGFVIALSYACNLKCSYCYQQHNMKLDKSKITKENLDSILSTILEYKEHHQDEYIGIELFGGEPLLPENREDIIKIFDFCVENGMTVGITTNGSFLDYYLKDLIIYRGLNMSIFTTVDSLYRNEATRCERNKVEITTHANSILQNVKLLIENGVRVSVAANIDKHNINQIKDMIEYYEKEDFLSNKKFSFVLGRVDDRFFETKYKDILSETDILEELGKIESLPEGVYSGFIKAPYELCKKIGLNYRQEELRGAGNYCWAVATFENVFYIDPDLDTFRCTYTVGRKELSEFKFFYENIENYEKPNRTYKDYKECSSCKIGGYCGGGCAQSARIDFKKQCESEKKHFEDFLNRIFYKKIGELTHEVASPK